MKNDKAEDGATERPVKEKADRRRGYERNLEPDRIVGATEKDGEILFLMRWKECEEPDLVPEKIANVRWPQIVIQFYKERILWYY
ncbi:chromobox protein homolog 1 [Trichonephila inaurata madagascariensis]|uniref:Chromobox protein homolog 1 n=1 Tax=Trichonephila inaurata madagascariensis TaxID=2747483 RepID=A0A8X6XZ72_9ARAC|nr:chromobox protein homolog 1 [Trichonephila inaurata madagascariensis]